MGHNRLFGAKKGFTLIEILIVVGVIAVLATVVFVILNPVEVYRETRDAVRVQDVGNISRAVGMYLLDHGSAGDPYKVYISLPDSSSDCTNVRSSLPVLEPGWEYACTPASRLFEINGLGWIPVDFTEIKSGSPLPRLPVDPVNSTDHYYAYTANNGYVVTADLESGKYVERVSEIDGGSDPERFETGSTISLWGSANGDSGAPPPPPAPRVDLAWGLASDPDPGDGSPVSGVAGYQVFRSTVASTSYAQIATVLAPSCAAAECAYADDGVGRGTTYYYVVRSFDAASNFGGYSNEISAAIP